LILKPLAVPLGVEAEYIPDLWRTRLDPEDEREERILVEQYKNEFELTSANYPDPGDLFEFANNKGSKYNDMVDRLSTEFSKQSQQFKKDLTLNALDIDRSYSLKVEMLDYSQRLYEFDEASRRGEKLNQSESLKKDRIAEEEARQNSLKQHQQHLQRQAQARLSPEEEQQRLFREAKERTERTEREMEHQMMTARNEAKSANLRQSSAQGRGPGVPGSNYDLSRSGLPLVSSSATVSSNVGEGEPPLKRPRR
jgi:hypothetical protein